MPAYKPKTLPFALAALTLGGCSHHAAHGHNHAHGHDHKHGPDHGHHAHGPDHFADPARFVAQWNDPARDAWQKPAEITATMALQPGQTALDLGAGTGYLLPPLRTAVGDAGQVIALDIEPAMIRFLQQEVSKAGWNNVRVHAATPAGPGLPASSVHSAVALNVWHHVADRVSYARELLQVLQPGGTLVIVDFLKEQTEGFGPPLAMRLSADEVLADLTAAGFVAEVVVETMPRHYVVRGRRPVAR